MLGHTHLRSQGDPAQCFTRVRGRIIELRVEAGWEGGLRVGFRLRLWPNDAGVREQGLRFKLRATPVAPALSSL